MIHEQCEEIGNRDIWKKSWHDKTPGTHGKGREYAVPYHPPNGKRTSPEPADKQSPGALHSQKRSDIPHNDT